MGWTFYLRSAEDELFYIGLNPRSAVATGTMQALVYVQHNRGAEPIRNWSRVYPLDTASVSPDGNQVRVGPNAFRLGHGQQPHLLHLEVDAPAGQSLLLDVEIRQEVPPWHDEGVVLIDDAATGAHFDYAMLCPQAHFSATARIGPDERRLAGIAYFDALQWLSAPLKEPLTWHWGFVHTGAHTLLVFEPHLPGSNGVFILARGAEELIDIVQEDWHVSQVLEDPRRLVYALNTGSTAVRLEVDISSFVPEQNQTRLAPFSIEIRDGAQVVRDAGRMVFELGHWKRL